jgi:hypothetical protein
MAFALATAVKECESYTVEVHRLCDKHVFRGAEIVKSTLMCRRSVICFTRLVFHLLVSRMALSWRVKIGSLSVRITGMFNS